MIDEKLKPFINNESKVGYCNYDLSTIKKLAVSFGNPQVSLKCIHIAGTNGKGSAAHFIENIFRTAGYRTGLYTSPHLIRINERIAIDGNPVDEEFLETQIDKIIEIINKDVSLNPTFFDILTMAAINIFLESNIDIAVIETGLGGRLDSTNIVSPICSVITDISMDHTAILGSDIQSISREKAGIIKNKIPVVTSNTNEESLKIIDAAAKENGCQLYILARDFSVSITACQEESLTFNYHSAVIGLFLENITIQTPVECQPVNAALAITTAMICINHYPKCTMDLIADSLSKCRIPGRFQTLSVKPRIIYDPAHNPSAFRTLINSVKNTYFNENMLLIITLMRDKDIDPILKTVKDSGIDCIYYSLSDYRGYIPDDSHSEFFKLILTDEPDIAKKMFQVLGDYSLIIFTGSFRIFNAAQCLSKLTNE